MKIDITTHNFDVLDKRLRELEPRTQKRVLQGAVTSAIRKARKNIKSKMPVSETQSQASKKYGHAKDNLKVKRLKRVDSNEKASRIDTGNAFWIMFYELGTKNQPARPFIQNTFIESVPEMLDQLQKRLTIGIEKEVQKMK